MDENDERGWSTVVDRPGPQADAGAEVDAVDDDEGESDLLVSDFLASEDVDELDESGELELSDEADDEVDPSDEVDVEEDVDEEPRLSFL